MGIGSEWGWRLTLTSQAVQTLPLKWSAVNLNFVRILPLQSGYRERSLSLDPLKRVAVGTYERSGPYTRATGCLKTELAVHKCIYAACHIMS